MENINTATNTNNKRKITQDFIFLIMNCKKYRTKALFQKHTWIPNLPSTILYYHVIGDPTMTTDYTFVKDGENENTLFVRCEDNYINLPKKVIRAYKAISDTYKFKYIFKTDDDQIVENCKFFTVLVNLLYNKEKLIHYGGNIVNVTQPYYSMYNTIHTELPDNIVVKPTEYCTGRFYFLSNGAVNYLIKKQVFIENEYIEDWAIGFYLHFIFKKNTFFIKTDVHFKDIDEKSDEYCRFNNKNTRTL